jgi:uncharacterized membrane protein
MYWSQQSLLLSNLKRADGVLLVLNLLFLFPVTLLPFVTQLMGERRDHWSPVLVFALTNLFAAFVLRAMWKHAVSRPDLAKGPEAATLAERVGLGIRFFVGAMVAGVLVALIDPRAGILCFVLMPIAHFVNYARDSLRTRGEARNDIAP